MSALPRPSYLSPEEYLRLERDAPFKSDYLNGIVVEAMAGARHRHTIRRASVSESNDVKCGLRQYFRGLV